MNEQERKEISGQAALASAGIYGSPNRNKDSATPANTSQLIPLTYALQELAIEIERSRSYSKAIARTVMGEDIFPPGSDGGPYATRHFVLVLIDQLKEANAQFSRIAENLGA